MSWCETLKHSKPAKPKNHWKRLPQMKKDAVRADLVKADELKAELLNYTHKAIALRHGIHKRTVNKLCKKPKT